MAMAVMIWAGRAAAYIAEMIAIHADAIVKRADSGENVRGSRSTQSTHATAVMEAMDPAVWAGVTTGPRQTCMASIGNMIMGVPIRIAPILAPR
jgi:hypothetical protein